MARAKQLPALEVSYNNSSYYVTVIAASDLYKACKVSTVEEDPEQGYQRLLNPNRAKKIADYIDSGNMIPGAIILSAQHNANLSFNNGQLKYTNNQGAFLIIDGQHRMYGCHRAEEEVYLPVCIFNELDLSTEVQYFLDINGTQKGVPKSLQLELEKFRAEPNSPEDIRLKLFDILNGDTNSPLYNKMSKTKSVRGKLSHVPFKKGIEFLFTSQTFNTFSFDKKAKLIINFLNALEGELLESECSRGLTNSALFQAFFAALPEIIHLVEVKHKNFKQSSFKDILSNICQIDFERHSGTNRQAIQSFTDEIIEKVSTSRNIELSDDELF